MFGVWRRRRATAGDTGEMVRKTAERIR